MPNRIFGVGAWGNKLELYIVGDLKLNFRDSRIVTTGGKDQ